MTAPDPAVRSIRIASTLAERFLELMHQRTNPGDGSAEMELRIGEAQQIYPEIWNHLDDARKVLAERQADTRAYDEIKTAQGPVRIGVTRVEVEDQVDIGLGGYSHTQTKEAFFNLDGYRAARKAITALMTLMPDVDWKAVERAENQEIAAVGSLGPVSPKRTLVWLAIAGGLVALTYAVWFFVIRIPPVDPAEREAKRQAERAVRIADLRTSLDNDPCNPSLVRDLAFQLSFETPPQDREAKDRYGALCDLRIQERTRAADDNPCDENAVANLVAILRPTKPKAARAAAAVYRDRCESSKSDPP
jgi:hypothetical protein